MTLSWPPSAVLSRPGTTAFAPTDIAGLSQWLKADQSSQIERISNSTEINRWRNASEISGPNVDAGGSTYRPVYSGTLNDRKVVTFPDGTDYMTAGNANNMGSKHLYTWVACQWLNTSNSGLWGKSSYASLQGRWAIYREGGYTKCFAQFATGGTPVVAIGRVADTAPGIFGMAMDRSAGTLQMRENGAVTGSATFSPNFGTSYSNSSNCLLGRYALNEPAGFYFVGSIGEVIFYLTDSPLTGAQILNVERYLASRWNIALA